MVSVHTNLVYIAKKKKKKARREVDYLELAAYLSKENHFPVNIQCSHALTAS